MASLAELYDLRHDGTLKGRVIGAVVKAAQAIHTAEAPLPGNQPARLAWAANALRGPEGEAPRMLWAVLAANADETVANIVASTDVQLQAAVNAAVDLFADNA